MLLASSKRARNSTTAVTCLPFLTAFSSAPTMRGSPPVRYNVCLMASTSGSAAACSRRSTTLLKQTLYRTGGDRSEEHTSELQSLRHLVCRLLLEKKKTKKHEHRR